MKALVAAVLMVAGLFQGGVRAADLSIALAAEVSSMDPHFINLQPNNNVAEHIYDRLITFDARMRMRPSLAESWRAIDDTTWEIRLRRGVRFHDGSEFTADDVVFSLDRPATITGSPGGFTIYTRAITQKIVVDPYTLRLRTAAPYPNLPVDLTGLVILSRKAASGASSADFDSGKAAVGTGPYRFGSFQRGNRIELVRNDAWWGGKPAWDRVIFRMIPADPARVAALLANDVQMIENVPTADIARLRQNRDLTLHTIVSNRMIHLHLDSHRAVSPFVTDKAGKPLDRNPLRDVRVRQAISKAINRPAIVDRVMEGLAIAAGQVVPEGFVGWAPALKPEPFDPDGARKLLAQAGFPDGFALTLHGPNNRYVNDEQIVQAVGQMLTRIGIAVRVETMPMSVYLPRAHKQEFSAMLLGWGVTTGEASYALRGLVATFDRDKGMGTFNLGRYSNPALDKLIEQSLATVDDGRRDKLFQQATEVLMADHGLIPLHYQVNVWATRRNLAYEPRIDERTYAFQVQPAR